MGEKVTIEAELIPVYIMGKKYMVPDSLTIMKAIEYSGYKYIRGCGCRGGICGACGTVYRLPNDYHIYTGLACQTVVQPNMYLAQLPFYPALRREFDWNEIKPEAEDVNKLYPELFRCVACNACTKVCPMDVEVMDYIAQLKRGDIAAAAKTSFDCIQCGICASRCMGELPQYHIAQLARRLAGAKITPRAQHVDAMVEAIEKAQFQEALDILKAMSTDDLKKLYTERQQEPHMGDEDWAPESDLYLLGRK